MDLRTHNLHSGSLKKRLFWSQWSDVSRCRKAMWTHFLNPGIRKNRTGRNRLSDVLSRRMAFANHNLPSERLKKRLLWISWSDVSLCQKAIRTYFLQPMPQKKKRLERSCLWWFMKANGPENS
jgi:hypothetical protein